MNNIHKLIYILYVNMQLIYPSCWYAVELPLQILVFKKDMQFPIAYSLFWPKSLHVAITDSRNFPEELESSISTKYLIFIKNVNSLKTHISPFTPGWFFLVLCKKKKQQSHSKKSTFLCTIKAMYKSRPERMINQAQHYWGMLFFSSNRLYTCLDLFNLL